MADQGSIGVSHGATAKMSLFDPAAASGISRATDCPKRSILPLVPPAVGTKGQRTLSSHCVQVWRGNPYNYSGADTLPQILLPISDGIISGTVKIQTSPGVLINAPAGYIVRLLYRPSGYLIASTKTDANGGYAFTRGVDKNELGNYVALAHDPTNTYNAVIADNLTPY
jgi:hypothetical protein